MTPSQKRLSEMLTLLGEEVNVLQVTCLRLLVTTHEGDEKLAVVTMKMSDRIPRMMLCELRGEPIEERIMSERGWAQVVKDVFHPAKT